MRIQDIMNTTVETIGPQEPVKSAWERMEAQRIRHLVVVEGRQIVGVVSDRDLGGSKAEASARQGKAVVDVMTSNPVSVQPTMTIREAANLLRGHTISCLPVVENGRLVGIVTTTDLLELIGRGAERPVEQGKRWTLKHRGPRHQKHVR